LLAACIAGGTSDLSKVLAPEFPISPGMYANPKGQVMSLSRTGDSYTFADASSGAHRLRFMRVPEYDGFVLQVWQEAPSGNQSYVYLFAKQIPRGIRTFVMDSEKYASLPPYIQRLTSAQKTGISVLNPERDTLYVVREIGRTPSILSAGDEWTQK
jgi:hypothetical protein